MDHVFVETNWLVSCFAPSHRRVPSAVDLQDRAMRGEIKIHLPGICRTECKRPIREKFQVRGHADGVRKFLQVAKRNGTVTQDEEKTVRLVLEKMEVTVQNELNRLDDELRNLEQHAGVEIFQLDDEMLVRAAELSNLRLDLEPFDQAILAAILVRAEQLKQEGIDKTSFCELDSDLQPWYKGWGARSFVPLEELV